MRQVLQEAIAAGGSSIDDYVGANGERGFFQLQHRVYGREGERCLKCRKTPVKRIVMSGNEALSIGAISAGCRYYAGYPITPASDILEVMEKDLPKFGGAVVQTEDEISAIASVVGASYAGKKAMTATSGPGLALMVEIMGLAAMSEIPCVIVDAQRGGPSTGLPTKMEQSDLNLAVYGAHGEAPRIVLAPGDVEECLYYIIHAFNLSEKYQCPVIFLTDQSLAHRTQTFAWPDFKRVPVINRLLPTPADLKEYKRFVMTESGVSPMALPGMEGGCYAATGLEHSERNLDVKALRGELEGFHRLRVGGYRIVYHYGAGQIVYLDYAELRDEVYEAFKRLRTLRESGEEPESE